ncbi:MAG: NUDIX domain-containing protein [Lachnospiraceae bacterium]|nr:NUDIX domain-containing protein [Lachnospiraceae bacterium]
MQQVAKMRNMTAIYLKCDDKLLLLYRQGSVVADEMWIGAAGGHFEPEELNDPKACVLREMKEELGLSEDSIKNLQLRYITLRNVKGEVRQNFYFFADLEDGEQKELTSNEGVLKWFTLQELQGLNMPFSARYMMDHYVEKGQFDDSLYGGISDGNKVVFTKMQEG